MQAHLALQELDPRRNLPGMRGVYLATHVMATISTTNRMAGLRALARRSISDPAHPVDPARGRMPLYLPTSSAIHTTRALPRRR